MTPLGMRRYLSFESVGTLVYALVVLGAFFVAAAPVTTNDLFWHVETGAHLWSVGNFPDRDVFSYTATDQPWFLHEWLTQVTFYGLHELGGMHLLRLFTGLMAIAILGVVWRFSRRMLGGRLPAAIAVIGFAILATDRFQTRPSLFSILFFTGFMRLLRQPSWPVAPARRSARHRHDLGLDQLPLGRAPRLRGLRRVHPRDATPQSTRW